MLLLVVSGAQLPPVSETPSQNIVDVATIPMPAIANVPPHNFALFESPDFFVGVAMGSVVFVATFGVVVAVVVLLTLFVVEAAGA